MIDIEKVKERLKVMERNQKRHKEALKKYLPLTLDDIAKEFNCTRPRISQIYKNHAR